MQNEMSFTCLQGEWGKLKVLEILSQDTTNFAQNTSSFIPFSIKMTLKQA